MNVGIAQPIIRQMSPNKGTQFVFPICRKPSNAILLQIAFQLFFEHCNNIDTYISEKMERGPSPLIPSLFLLCLGFLIYWPSLFSILDTLLTSLQWISEVDEKSVATLILVLLVLLVYAFIHLPSSFPFSKSSYGINRHVSISSHDYAGFEFGLGTLLLFLLFILLYNLF